MRREQRHRRDERIGEQEAFDRVRQAHRGVGLRGERAAERRLDEKKHEEREARDLHEAPRPDEPADDLARRDSRPGPLGGASSASLVRDGGVALGVDARGGLDPLRKRGAGGAAVAGAARSSAGTSPTLPSQGIGAT